MPTASEIKDTIEAQITNELGDEAITPQEVGDILADMVDLTETKATTAALDNKMDKGLTVNAQTGTTYTLLASDNGKMVRISNSSAITLTVPSGLGSGFNCLVVQGGDGQITISASGVTLNNRYSFTKSSGKYGVIGIFATAADVLLTTGDMTT